MRVCRSYCLGSVCNKEGALSSRLHIIFDIPRKIDRSLVVCVKTPRLIYCRKWIHCFHGNVQLIWESAQSARGLSGTRHWLLIQWTLLGRSGLQIIDFRPRRACAMLDYIIDHIYALLGVRLGQRCEQRRQDIRGKASEVTILDIGCLWWTTKLLLTTVGCLRSMDIATVWLHDCCARCGSNQHKPESCNSSC